MKFANPQIEAEWEETKVDHRLRRLMSAVDTWCVWNLGKQLTLTDVLRTDPNSPHCYGRACDVRTFQEFSDQEAVRIRDWTSLNFPYMGGAFSTTKFEKKGDKNPNGSTATGDHLHFQVRSLT